MDTFKNIDSEVASRLVAFSNWLRDPEGLRAELRREEGLVTAEIVGFVVLGLLFLGFVGAIINATGGTLTTRIADLVGGL